MKKYVTFLELLLLLNGINAQIVNSQNADIGFDLNTSYNMAYNRPIIRAVSDSIIVSYHEVSHHGVFSLLVNNSSVAKTIELPQYYFAKDFEILNGTIYFCGERFDGNFKSSAVLGKLLVNDFLTSSSININFITFREKKAHFELKKMEVYRHQNLGDVIISIGSSNDYETVIHNNDTTIQINNSKDFLIVADSSLTIYLDYYEFNDEIYHDVIETDNHIILAGILRSNTYQYSTLFRKIEKSNYNSNSKDNRFICSYTTHQEPLTFVLGEGLIGSNRFVTSTFANINGVNGTILRTYNVSNMVNTHNQFIPAKTDEKTEPLELKYMNPITLLLLQYSTISGTQIFRLSPTPSNSYNVEFEYLLNRNFYSLDKYSQDSYIAIGYSVSNIAYAARYLQSNNISCFYKNTILATKTTNPNPSVRLQGIIFTSIIADKTNYTLIPTNVNINITCP